MEKPFIDLKITVDLEKVDEAFARLVKARDEFWRAAMDFGDAIEGDSLQICIKEKPQSAATDQGQ
jgi:hypothetical protein